MNVMVIGSGGREHAIVKALGRSRDIDRLYCLPGNGGIAADAVCADISATDIAGMVGFARKNAIDYCVVAPDDPLVLGMVDALSDIGVECFGPTKNAAIIEGSKAFSKKLMKKYGIPTADYEIFYDAEAALEYVARAKTPIVVKADGLALGKGVLICMSREEAASAVRDIMENSKFGASGRQIVVEEFLEGPEVSVLAFTDGETLVPMKSSMDHKRALDGDSGLNTGGMGAVAPNPYYTDAIAEECMERIFLPTMRAMNVEGRTFKGCLYFGLMLTKDGPKVIEYNCRFGDPEAQAVLPLLENDLFDVFRAVSGGYLKDIDVRFADRHSCCVVIASQGYPVKYEKGCPIFIPETGEGETAYVAGAKLENGALVSSGGRVLGMTAVGDSLNAAIDRAYALAARVKFDNGYYRRDIGANALKAVE